MNRNSSCQPPYAITPAIVHLVARISEAVGRLTVIVDQPSPLRLRRINRIRTIRGSLAIEGNTLSEAQVTAILEGKRVIAPPREVQEVRNAPPMIVLNNGIREQRRSCWRRTTS